MITEHHDKLQGHSNQNNSGFNQTEQLKHASLYDLITLSLNGMTFQTIQEPKQEAPADAYDVSLGQRIETLNMQEFLQDAIKKNSLFRVGRRQSEEENQKLRQGSPSAIERQLQKLLNESEVPNIVEESAQFQIEARKVSDSEQRTLQLHSEPDIVQSQRVLNPYNINSEHSERIPSRPVNEFMHKQSRSGVMTHTPPPLANVKKSSPDIQREKNRTQLEQEQKSLYDKIEKTLTPSTDIPRKAQLLNPAASKPSPNDVSRKSVGKQRSGLTLAEFQDKANKSQGLVGGGAKSTKVVNSKARADQYSSKRGAVNTSIIQKENEEANRKERLLSAVNYQSKNLNTTTIQNKETPKSYHYDLSSITNFKSQNRAFTPKERSQSSDKSRSMVRVKSTKSNLRLGSDTSLNMEEIRQKVAQMKNFNDKMQTQTPKGLGALDNNERSRLFSDDNNKTSDGFNFEERQMVSTKKRVQNSSNLRGSKRTLNSEPKVTLIKPIFQNQQKPSQKANTSTIRSSQKITKSQNTLNPVETEESLYSADASQKYGYQSPNVSTLKDKSMLTAKGTDSNKYELNSNSSASHSQSNKNYAPKQKSIYSKLTKQPTKRQQMNKAVGLINVGVIEEFTRIKKPHKQALLIGKLYCLLLCTFRSPMLSQDFSYELVQQEFDKWESIQYFIYSNPNRTLNETTQIKQRAPQKGMTNQEFAKKMIVTVTDNEAHLKNIPNKNLKLIFEMIQRILIYVDYKQFKKQSRKNSGETNKDLKLIEDSSSNQITIRNTEEDDDYREDDSEREEQKQSQIFNYAPDPRHDHIEETRSREDQYKVESVESNRVETTQIAEILMNEKYNTQLKNPLATQSSGKKIEQLRKNYSPLSRNSNSPGSFQSKHNFNQSSPEKKSPKLQPTGLSKEVTQEIQLVPKQQTLLVEQEEPPVFPEIEIKVDLNSEAQKGSQFDKKSFIEKKASEIIQEMLQIKDHYAKSHVSSRVNEDILIPEAELMRDTSVPLMPRREISEQIYQVENQVQNEIQEEIKASKYNTYQSQTHSRKNSIKIIKPELQPSDSEGSPISAITRKSDKTSKSYSPTKSSTKKSAKSSKKGFSPTQKLIKFKNKTHKTKLKNQNTDMSFNQIVQQELSAYSPVLNQKVDYVEAYASRKLVEMGYEQTVALEKAKQSPVRSKTKSKDHTPQSVHTSQKTFDDIQYQIQVLNKDIFTYEENSNTEHTARDTSLNESTYQPPQPKIQVFERAPETQIPRYNPQLTDDDIGSGGFTLKLMKVQDYTSQDGQYSSARSSQVRADGKKEQIWTLLRILRTEG